MNLLLAPDQVTGEARPAHRSARPTDAVLIAVLAALVSGAAAGRPSLWFDEAATISAAANRSLPELWRLLRNVDAVHGLYYLVMHGWFAVFPATEFWSRLPSCLAVGAGAAGVVVLVKQFCARRVAVCAGVLFAILPRMTWAGIEARSYAFSAMAAVWLTVLCVAAARRNTARVWLGYGLLIVVSTLLNAFTVLVLAAHAVALRLLDCGWSAARRWAVTTGIAVAASAPFLVFSQTQIRQVGWISPLSWHTVTEVAQQQYFDKSTPFAVLAGVVIATAAAAVLAGVRQLPTDGTRQLSVICVAWVLAPTVITLTYSAIGKPVYYPRYLICTAPAMAVLLAICITTVAGRRWAAIALVALFAVAAVPNYVLTQRSPYAKEGWDYSQVADLVQAQAKPGDCLLVDNTTAWAPGPIRALLAARPDAFAGLLDPGRGPRGPALGRLWDGHLAVWSVTDQLDQCATVWTLTNHDRTQPAGQAGDLPPGPVFARSPAGQVLHRLGFDVAERWQFTFTQVVRSVR